MDQDLDALLTNAILNLEPENEITTNDFQEDVKPKRVYQIFAGVAATLSAFSSGMVLGWTSPILDCLSNGKYRGIQIDDTQLGWIGSFVTLGASVMCIPTGILIDIIGRKKTLLLIILPFSIGWTLIIFANNIMDLYLGRFITGMAVGASCIAGPVYTSEIAHKSMRGTLGSFFQLMIVTGVLMAYFYGELLTVDCFTISCAVSPLIFFILFVFQPETPTFLLIRGYNDQAKNSLLKLRGKYCNVESELNEIADNVKENLETSVSIREIYCQKCTKRAILISFALMFFQQFSGINVILFYTSDIFKASGTKLNANLAAMIVGACQVISTLVASIIIDKVGRRLLLIISTSIITLNILLLAIYFTLKYSYINNDILREISFVPVAALSLFIIAFSLGLGPIPWVISSEIFPVKIKSILVSISATFNWFFAFLLTKFYLEISNIIREDSMFYIFATLSFIGFIFVLFIVPETKGKTINEILCELEN